jgi:lysophospholipase L1-like esterase
MKFPKFALAWLAILTAASSSAAEKLPRNIPLDHPGVQYIGRFTEDRTCGWTGAQIAFGFEGTSAEVDFVGTKSNNYFRVDIDGQMVQPIHVGNGAQTIRVADGLPKGRHVVRLTRRTEALFGEVQVAGLRLDAEAKMGTNTPKAERTVLSIGDSITCGYGNGTTDKNEHLLPEREFGDTTYAALAAQRFGAEYHCVAWSGRGIYRNRGANPVPEKNTMPAIFERILPQRADSPLFDPKAIKPDVITINLNTNDFDPANPAPPKEEFVAVYQKFVKRLQEWWPAAKIVCISGPMVGAEGRAREFVQASAEGLNQPDKVSFLVLTRNVEKEGLGGDWHPSQATHDANSKALAEHLAKVTGWKYENTD